MFYKKRWNSIFFLLSVIYFIRFRVMDKIRKEIHVVVFQKKRQHIQTIIIVIVISGQRITRILNLKGLTW